MSFSKELIRGIWKENPIFILVLGMCPTLAVSTSVINGIGMGIATTFVLICSNIVISLIRSYVPDQVRIPVYIVLIASFVTVVDLVISGFFRPVSCPRHLHSPDRCKLHHPRAGRGVCLQEFRFPVHCRRDRDGCGIHAGAGDAREHQRTPRKRLASRPLHIRQRLRAGSGHDTPAGCILYAGDPSNCSPQLQNKSKKWRNMSAKILENSSCQITYLNWFRRSKDRKEEGWTVRGLEDPRTGADSPHHR